MESKIFPLSEIVHVLKASRLPDDIIAGVWRGAVFVLLPTLLKVLAVPFYRQQLECWSIFKGDLD